MDRQPHSASESLQKNQELQAKAELEPRGWYIAVSSAFGRLRWEDCEFAASLGYVANTCHLNTQNNEEKNRQQ